MKTKWIVFILGTVLAFSLGAQATESYKVAYLPQSIGQPNTNAWMVGLKGVFNQFDTVKFQAFDAQLNAQTQVSMMDDLINQHYDLIYLQPMDAAGLSASVKEAESKGIVVITLNLDTIAKHSAHVTMADIEAGYGVGVEMGKQLGGKGNVAIIQSPPGASLGVNREKGFRMALAKLYPEIKIVGAQSAEGWAKDKAISIMNGFLQANAKLDGVFAVNDNMAEGAMIAAESAGRLKNIKIWGANGQKSTLALIEQGKIAGTAYNNCFDQGATAANLGMWFLTSKGGPSKAPQTGVIKYKSIAVTAENVGQIKPEDRW